MDRRILEDPFHELTLVLIELQQEITRDQSRYIRHSLRTASPPATPSSAGQTPTPTPTSTSTSGFKPHIPAKVASSYAELGQLADEKIALAQRVIELLARTRSRLDADLAKVRVLQGEVGAGELSRTYAYSGASTPLAASGDSFLAGRSPASAIGDNLRSALLANEVLALSPVASGSSTPAHKKRRLTATNSIKLPSPAPQTAVLNSSTHSRSRLSRQIHPPRPVEEEIPEPENDPDAEGDEDFEADDAEDSTLYCFCQKPSSGEMMIGCDNPECPYQWFHISCVGVKQPLPDKWYCPECKSKGAGAHGRKGRKKANS